MIDYLKKIVSDFTETIEGRLAIPAAEHLFSVRDDATMNMLVGELATEFHHEVTKLLFSTPRVRKDI